MVEPINIDYGKSWVDWVQQKSRRVRLKWRGYVICRKQGHYLKMDAMHCLRCGARTW